MPRSSDFSLWVLIGLCLLGSAQAGLKPEAFAAGFQLQELDEAPFYRLTLPQAVYEGVVYADLRDLALFNAADEPLPHALVATPPSESIQEHWLGLPAFRLPDAPASRPQGDLALDTGQWQLRWSQPGQTEPAQLLLVQPDLTDLKPLAALQLQWPDSASGWRQTLSLAWSRDLQQWQPLLAEVTLLDLQQDGQRLRQDRLEFPHPVTAPYWRLSLQGELRIPPLTAVRGLERRRQSLPPTPIRIAVPRVPGSPDSAPRYRFSNPQRGDSLQILLPQLNSLALLELDYRMAEDGPWLSLGTQRVQRLTQEGQVQESPPIPLPAVTLAELRLRPDATGWGSQVPQVELLRPPLQLLFNARGPGPFRLVYGNNRAERRALTLEQLLPPDRSDDWLALPEARLGEALVLGGDAMRQQPDPEADRRRLQQWLLWGTLLAGALGLAWLAWRVFRDLQGPSDGTSS